MAIKTPVKSFTESDVIAFAKFFYKGMRIFGQERVQKKLEELYLVDKDNCQNAIRTKIFDEVSAEYKMTPEAIITSAKRGNVTQAKVMAMLLLHRHMNISQVEIAMLFSRGASLVSKRIKLFNSESRNDKIYSDKNFMITYEKINKKINSFKESWEKKKK